MGLRSWWLQTRLARIERKLRHLRGLQKIAREKEHAAELERLTHTINELVLQEHGVKAALESAT